MNPKTETLLSQIEPAPIESEGFHVTDEKSANWVVRKILDARAYRNRIEAWAAAEIERADREEKFFSHRYGSELEAWARKQIGDHKRRVIALPAGRIGFRKASLKLNVTDEDRLLDWCKNHLPSALKVMQRILISQVKDHVTHTGEMSDGKESTGGGRRFYVK